MTEGDFMFLLCGVIILWVLVIIQVRLVIEILRKGTR